MEDQIIAPELFLLFKTWYLMLLEVNSHITYQNHALQLQFQLKIVRIKITVLKGVSTDQKNAKTVVRTSRTGGPRYSL